MLFILYTTGQCNLRCKYCGGSFDENVVPWEVKYSVDDLKKVIGGEDDVAFYGGEPLLNMDFIEEVMAKLNPSHYILQTNGILLDKLDPELIKRFDVILVSIDGPRWLTDLNRGRGVYDTVIRNVKWLKEIGYEGDLVARMTITEESEILRDVKHLLNLKLFDHIHWQLSFVWAEPWHNLWSWIRESYEPGLKKLLDQWIEKMRYGVVEGIAPFQGIFTRILRDGVKPPCGSGADSFTIVSDGRIIACPIAVRESWAYIGRLGEVDKEKIKSYKPPIGEPCLSCRYFKICGGRCLYTHMERLWGEEGMRAICEVSKFIIDSILERMSIIEKFLDEGMITEEQLIYPKYNNTIEIMP